MKSHEKMKEMKMKMIYDYKRGGKMVEGERMYIYTKK